MNTTEIVDAVIKFLVVEKFTVKKYWEAFGMYRHGLEYQFEEKNPDIEKCVRKLLELKVTPEEYETLYKHQEQLREKSVSIHEIRKTVAATILLSKKIVIDLDNYKKEEVLTESEKEALENHILCYANKLKEPLEYISKVGEWLNEIYKKKNVHVVIANTEEGKQKVLEYVKQVLSIISEASK